MPQHPDRGSEEARTCTQRLHLAQLGRADLQRIGPILVELLKGMSPALKKRMQGKACFNFTTIDEDCFAELSRLAAAGLKLFKSQKFLKMLKGLQ